jgi:hypothetical protein
LTKPSQILILPVKALLLSERHPASDEASASVEVFSSPLRPSPSFQARAPQT